MIQSYSLNDFDTKEYTVHDVVYLTQEGLVEGWYLVVKFGHGYILFFCSVYKKDFPLSELIRRGVKVKCKIVSTSAVLINLDLYIDECVLQILEVMFVYIMNEAEYTTIFL